MRTPEDERHGDDAPVAPIADNITAMPKAKPGPKPKADLIQQHRQAVVVHATQAIDGCLRAIADCTPGQPGAEAKLWHAAGAISGAMGLLRRMDQLIPAAE